MEEAVASVRRKLTAYSDYVVEHETRTRVLLVDEIVCSLGWVVTDPGRVWLEHQVNGSKLDYVLLKQGRWHWQFWRRNPPVKDSALGTGGRLRDMR